MTHSTSRRLIGIMFRPACQILILIGLATLLLSVVTIWQYQASTRRTKETNARVISVNKITGIGDDERGRNNQACQVDYRFRIKGDEYTAILGYRGEPTTDKCRLHSGQSVKIKYDPNHPANNAYLPDAPPNYLCLRQHCRNRHRAHHYRDGRATHRQAPPYRALAQSHLSQPRRRRRA